VENIIYTSKLQKERREYIYRRCWPGENRKVHIHKKIMDLLVIPNIENEFSRARAKDELPQSASGRTIMTTEPKFVPNEAIKIELDENVHFKVRLVDCVGYMVKGAIGHMENDMPRMVSTPWFDEQIPLFRLLKSEPKKLSLIIPPLDCSYNRRQYNRHRQGRLR